MRKIYLNYTFAFILSLLAFNINAQVTVGTGTGTTGTSPINSCYGYTYSEQIYLQSEIGAGGNITSVSFYMATKPSSTANSEDWTVYMGHTTKSDYSSTTDWVTSAGLTQVFTGTVSYPAAGNWMTITLATPFAYNNTDNLVIAVDENMTGYNCSAVSWNATSTGSDYRTIYNYSDAINPDPATPPTGTRSYNRPNIQLGGITQSCPATSALMTSNLTSTSVDLGWTENGSATSWEVEYGAAGFTQGTGTSAVTSTNPHALSSLTANTSYDFYVRAICGVGDTSTWTGPTSFYTGYCVASPSSVDGSGITNVTIGTINNTTSTETGNYGDYSAMVADIAQGTTVACNITYSTGYTYGTKIWIDWNDDLDFDDAGELVYTGLSTSANPTTLNASIAVPLTATLGNHRMRIGGTDNDTGPSSPCYTGSYGSFEDYTVNVTAPPACLPTSALTATNLTFTSADLGWMENGSATSWEVEYGVAGFTLGTGTIIVTGTNPLSISSLTPSTAYDFYVRAICGAGDTSILSPLGSFFTGYCDASPSSVDALGIVNVTMGTINNATGTEQDNYGDYSAMVSNAVQGSTFNIDVTYQTGYTYDTWAWVDWNNDLDFDDAGEAFYLGESTNANPTTLSGSIMIPATASLGNHRIRIGGADSGLGSTSPSNPCYTGSYGAFEDYTLNVTLPLADDVRVSAVTAGNCSSTEMVTIDITNLGTVTQTSIPVSYSVNGGTPVMETWTGSIANGVTVQYTFAATFDASMVATYSINASTNLASDGDVANDMSTTSVTTGVTYTTNYGSNFESTLPMDWTSNGFIGSGHNAGSNVLYRNMYSTSTSTFTTTTPKIEVVAGDFASFAYRYSDYIGSGTVGTTLGAGDTLNVQVSTDCGATFTTVDQIHAGNHITSAAYATLSYDLTAYAGQTVVFRMDAVRGAGDYYLDVDNFFVGVSMTQSATASDVLCVGAANGSGTITAVEGLTPYTYAWSNGATTMTTMTLPAGVNYYTVTDAVGAMIMDSVTVGAPAVAMSAMTSVDAMVSCNGAMDAGVSVMGMNGAAPYSYTWTNGMTTDSLMNIGAGLYAVVVTDANGCITFESVTVSEPMAMTSTTMATDITCNGAADGTAMTTVMGGTGTPTYTWSNADTTASLTGLVAGTYDVTATDANGCMTTGSVTVAEPMAITATAATDSDVTCNGAANGAATVTATGGTGMLTYMWSNGSTMMTASNLSGGAYDVTVTDANGCMMMSNATIAEPNALTLTLTSVSDSLRLGNGSATATVTGGTAPYTYAWDGNAAGTDASLTNLVEGIHTIVVTDANGCIIDGFVSIADIVGTTEIDYVTNLSVYPNPTSGNTVIDLELSQNADVAISIYTVTGVLVQDFGKENTSKSTHQIDLSGYAAGMYLVRFVVGNQVITKKLVVNK